MKRDYAPALTLLAAALYWLATGLQDSTGTQFVQRPTTVSMSAPVQVLMYGGDRFLAADIEAIRAVTAVTEEGSQSYRLSAHSAVSQLNPCHEDNYWIGNASLSWGGQVDQGFELLGNATQCRFWDEWTAFFYGFNMNFFRQDITAAQQALELAIKRTTENAAVFRTFSTMLTVSKINNTRMALKMLEHERDIAKDLKLREMLNKRVIRLKGLLILREAQDKYEKQFGQPLKNPQTLLEQGLLEQFPKDPLNLGYEFRGGDFRLRNAKIGN